MPSCVPRKVLKGQKVLVTGANSGIDKGIAIELGKAGADVVINFRSGEEAAQQVADEIIATGSRAYIHNADVSQESQIVAMFDRMMKEFGTIDILINNAGLQKDAAIEDMTLDQWNTVLGVNLTGQ
jgi:glucose 1-dehydrogenase